MTEPTPEPTLHDEIQDTYISALQEIVTPSYTPPQDVEYSFPVTGQGISADQYRLMNLGQANGIIHGDNGVVNDSPNSTGYRYYLEGHATNAETNQRNTLMLRAGTSAEAILEGFYHRLSEDMELSFPSVTTPTTYHVCLTFDPRREDEPTGPIHVEVYAGEPPSTHGRIHLILHTVERQPNQLLSQATITRYRPYTAGIVSVQNVNQLPDVDSYPAGTLAVPSSDEGTGVYVRSNTHPRRWINTGVGEWQTFNAITGNDWAGSGRARRRVGGVDVIFDINNTRSNTSTAVNAAMFNIPYDLSRPYHAAVFTTDGPRNFYVESGGLGRLHSSPARPGWTRGNLFIPDYYLA